VVFQEPKDFFEKNTEKNFKRLLEITLKLGEVSVLSLEKKQVKSRFLKYRCPPKYR